MQLVPLLAWSRVGETHDMAKVFEWMLLQRSYEGGVAVPQTGFERIY